MTFEAAKNLLVQAWGEFNKDNAPRLGAALAYYTVLSIAPLLIVVVAVAGMAFGKEAAEGQLFGQIRSLVGDQSAQLIQQMIRSASNIGQGILASLFGLATLLFGATNVVTELRNSLNVIWDVPAKQDTGVVQTVKERSYAFGVVLACGFLLLVMLVVSALISGVEAWFSRALPLPGFVLQGINFLVSLAVITGIFALLFKYLPDIEIQWSDVLGGALFTAVLFTIGKTLIGLYLGNASFSSSYGAAGSLAIVLVWVYYSSQILFFGAEFTQVYASTQHPQTNANPTPSALKYKKEGHPSSAGRAADS